MVPVEYGSASDTGLGVIQSHAHIPSQPIDLGRRFADVVRIGAAGDRRRRVLRGGHNPVDQDGIGGTRSVPCRDGEQAATAAVLSDRAHRVAGAALGYGEAAQLIAGFKCDCEAPVLWRQRCALMAECDSADAIPLRPLRAGIASLMITVLSAALA